MKTGSQGRDLKNLVLENQFCGKGETLVKPHWGLLPDIGSSGRDFLGPRPGTQFSMPQLGHSEDSGQNALGDFSGPWTARAIKSRKIGDGPGIWGKLGPFSAPNIPYFHPKSMIFCFPRPVFRGKFSRSRGPPRFSGHQYATLPPLGETSKKQNILFSWISFLAQVSRVPGSSPIFRSPTPHLSTLEKETSKKHIIFFFQNQFSRPSFQGPGPIADFPVTNALSCHSW